MLKAISGRFLSAQNLDSDEAAESGAEIQAPVHAHAASEWEQASLFDKWTFSGI
jgi:hypothetical protein